VNSIIATVDQERVTAAPGSAWQVEVDRVDAAEWSHMLDLFDDANIYQTWSYGAVRWEKKSQPPGLEAKW